MLRKYVFGFLLFIGFGFVVTGKAYAAVNVELEDDKENKSISVIVNSNGSYVGGLDMNIIYSDDVTIKEITPTEGLCKFGGNTTFNEERINIECFNDVDTEMSGVLATITYESESEDYFFYVDENTLDFGSLIIGDILNVNKPENIETDEVDTTDEIETEEASLFDTVSTFLSDNALYVLAGVITLIAIILAVGGLTEKGED